MAARAELAAARQHHDAERAAAAAVHGAAAAGLRAELELTREAAVDLARREALLQVECRQLRREVIATRRGGVLRLWG